MKASKQIEFMKFREHGESRGNFVLVWSALGVECRIACGSTAKANVGHGAEAEIFPDFQGSDSARRFSGCTCDA